MKKMESNVRSGRDHMREPRPGKRGGNVRMRVERMAESVDVMLAESGHDTKEAVGKSEGKEKQTDGEEAMMVRMTYVAINDGEKRLYHSTEGSEEIVGFFQLVDEGKAELRQKLHIVTNGTKVAFAEYHTTAEEACDIICKELDI